MLVALTASWVFLLSPKESGYYKWSPAAFWQCLFWFLGLKLLLVIFSAPLICFLSFGPEEFAYDDCFVCHSPDCPSYAIAAATIEIFVFSDGCSVQ